MICKSTPQPPSRPPYSLPSSFPLLLLEVTKWRSLVRRRANKKTLTIPFLNWIELSWVELKGIRASRFHLNATKLVELICITQLQIVLTKLVICELRRVRPCWGLWLPSAKRTHSSRFNLNECRRRWLSLRIVKNRAILGGLFALSETRAEDSWSASTRLAQTQKGGCGPEGGA